MKKLLFLLLLFLAGNLETKAQTFENGLSLYEQGDYERAIRILVQSTDPEAILFTGKSYFALNNHLKAVSYLNKITSSDEIDIYQEAVFTKALALFQLDRFATSLDLLKELSQQAPSTSVTREAITLYDQVLGYLTVKQRRNVFISSDNDDVRLDLLESSIGFVDFHSANSLLEIFKNSVLEYDRLKISRIETLLSDSVTYSQRYNPNRVLSAPKGISYNLGVLLPEFDFDTPEFEIPQHLYFGIQIAVEQFNGQNADQKVFITYRDTNSEEFSPETIVNDLVWNQNVDVIVGPLFSQVAAEYAELAEQYEIPMLLPLANADSLDLYNNFVFQLNPSFETQGRQMAEYAVNVLGYDTLGVIAESKSLGAPAARSFRHEVQRLGGFIEYYFEEDFEADGYDIRDYTQFFTTDTLDSVAIVEAVFAPFTGTIAQTLIESMLTDLEAMRSEVAILGSEEWANVNLENRRLSETELYYTQSFSVDTSLTSESEFASLFRLRFNTDPNQFAYIGFDAANTILRALDRVKNPSNLRDALKDINRYRGLSIDINFNGSHVNQEIKVKRMPRDSDLEEALDEEIKE